MKPFSFSFILLFLLLLSCKKEKLPKPTQQGKNTFGCKVDGKLFVPKDVITVPVTPGLIAFYDEAGSNYFELRVTENKDEENGGLRRTILFKIFNLTVGTNNLNEQNKVSVKISVDNNQLDKSYETNSTTGGILTVTRLDTNQNIISGTFSFVAAPKQANSQNVHVTEGRFDISYK